MPEVSFAHYVECWILASPIFFFFLYFNCSIAIFYSNFYIVIYITCTVSFLQKHWNGNDFTAKLYCNYYGCCAKAFMSCSVFWMKNSFSENRFVEAVNYSVKKTSELR